MDAIDDNGTDVNRLFDRIVNGVMHHPAQREMGRDGVPEARQLIFEMRKLYGEPETLETKIAGAAADAIFQGATGAISGIVEQNTGIKLPATHGSQQQEKHEEGGLGGFLSTAGSLLGLGKNETERRSSQRRDDGSYTRTDTVWPAREPVRPGRVQRDSASRRQQRILIRPLRTTGVVWRATDDW